MPDDCRPFALIADDDPLVRMNSAEIVKNAGFEVFEASGVEPAGQILDANGGKISLLFTDVPMPPSQRDGFDLARVCAAALPDVHILVASAMVQPTEDDLPGGWPSSETSPSVPR